MVANLLWFLVGFGTCMVIAVFVLLSPSLWRGWPYR
jgi:hypothetical protein